ncbi:hypothetical protein [Tepidibacillus fermentans]|uniref:hypothetical protein n=1 Tax=Tepidibacillus fermentans TaxID=1281767 RepID=UPI0014048F05|nr:hypothetical protein [Tepidibacillus fermentans]
MPIHYQQILQGLIYRKLLSKELSEFLHNQGFFYHKRSFKLFTFSRLFGTHIFDHRTKRMIFTDDIYWQVSSVNPEFIQELGQRLLLSDQL